MKRNITVSKVSTENYRFETEASIKYHADSDITTVFLMDTTFRKSDSNTQVEMLTLSLADLELLVKEARKVQRAGKKQAAA